MYCKSEGRYEDLVCKDATPKSYPSIMTLSGIQLYSAGDNQNSGILQPKRVIYSGVKIRLNGFMKRLE
jgi:hypothetical protein